MWLGMKRYGCLAVYICVAFKPWCLGIKSHFLGSFGVCGKPLLHLLALGLGQLLLCISQQP